MIKEDFVNFYNKIIKSFAQKFVADNEGFEFVDNPSRIYEEYLNQKSLMKIIMDKTGTGQLLDRHKVCAAMTVAILKSRLVIDTNLNDENADFELTESTQINEQIAFYSSWALLISFVEADDEVKKPFDAVLPKTTHNSGFADTFARSLFFANVQNSLCPELIANVYFLLEAYNLKESEKTEITDTKE